jgi:hypothetical protein
MGTSQHHFPIVSMHPRQDPVHPYSTLNSASLFLAEQNIQSPPTSRRHLEHRAQVALGGERWSRRAEVAAMLPQPTPAAALPPYLESIAALTARN